MSNNINVIGNDDRMDYVAAYFYSLGYDVNRDVDSIDKDSITVMQPPVTRESMAGVLPYLTPGQIIYGGGIKEDVLDDSDKKLELIDYLKWDNIVSDNAYLTAKGIIRQAFLSKAVLEESNCLVTGYGFCGKAIAGALQDITARVDVAVRNKNLKSEIEENEYQFVDICKLKETDLSKYSYVFNTVPAMIIDQAVIDRLSQNVMIFDIASKPGGVDFDYCLSKDIFFLHSLGIPGKEYPKEAGEIIAKAVAEHIKVKLSS